MEVVDSEHSSTSSDEELFDLVAGAERVARVYRTRPDPFQKYSDSEFRDRYRFHKDTVQTIIIALLEDDLAPVSLRKCCLSAADQLFITLRFYATGSFQILVGDDYGIHKSTVCRVIQVVSERLASLCPNFIKMPEGEEKNSVKQKFHLIRGFPNVVGCVDGTHIPIISPGGDNAELFRNRKNYFSINVQGVCDADLLIRDIVARWPGSTHDSTIWNGSLLAARCETGEFEGSYILGDSAYACAPYMMTPLLNPTTHAEVRYNNAHKSTRNCIERCFGVWKRRFPCLSLGLRTKLETTLIIIVATAVLHNIAIKENDVGDDFEDVQGYEDMDPEINGNDVAGGNAARMALIDAVFQ